MIKAKIEYYKQLLIESKAQAKIEEPVKWIENQQVDEVMVEDAYQSEVITYDSAASELSFDAQNQTEADFLTTIESEIQNEVDSMNPREKQ